jgi:hypothetical protein
MKASGNENFSKFRAYSAHSIIWPLQRSSADSGVSLVEVNAVDDGFGHRQDQNNARKHHARH